MQNEFLKKYGPWAVVTGGSSGIGEAFCHALAQKGLNIVLVARNQLKLQALSQELKSKYNVQTKVVIADLQVTNDIEKICIETDQLEIGLLINNAGSSDIRLFINKPADKITDQIYLQCLAPLRLTHFFARQMATRKRGGVIFVSSTAGLQSIPYLADYSAVKSFLLTFGEALHEELKPENIDVTVVCPGPTDTPGFQELTGLLSKNMGLPVSTSAQVANKTLRALQANRPLIIVGFTNKLLMFLARILGRQIWLKLVSKNMKKTVELDRR